MVNDLTAMTKRRQMQRDRATLQHAASSFDTATDNKTKAVAMGVIVATALRTTGYDCTRKKDREEFAKLCSELVKHRGTVELLGIDRAIEAAVKEYDLKTLSNPDDLPDVIKKRLDKLV